MPADIRIDDLVNPRFPDGFHEQIKALAPMADALAFEPGEMIDAACKKTGLEDFGPAGWEKGLEVVLQGLREGPALSTLGKENPSARSCGASSMKISAASSTSFAP